MIPSKGNIRIESGFDTLVFGALDENNQILDTHSFGQGWVVDIDFFLSEDGTWNFLTVQNDDGTVSQDCY